MTKLSTRRKRRIMEKLAAKVPSWTELVAQGHRFRTAAREGVKTQKAHKAAREVEPKPRMSLEGAMSMPIPVAKKKTSLNPWGEGPKPEGWIPAWRRSR